MGEVRDRFVAFFFFLFKINTAISHYNTNIPGYSIAFDIP